MSEQPDPEPKQPESVACTRCGCCDLRVFRTRHKPNRIIRERLCRHCGKRILTTEHVMGAAFGEEQAAKKRKDAMRRIAEAFHDNEPDLGLEDDV